MINEARKLSTKIINLVNWVFPRYTLIEIFRQKECYLCEQVIYRKLPICASCEHDLPWNDHPCSSCALPLPPVMGSFESTSGKGTMKQCSENSAKRICGNCLRDKPHYEQCTSVFCYSFPINTLVGDFKYRGKRHYGKLLSHLLAQHIKEPTKVNQHGWPTVLIPVPLHNKRIRERGFNQSEDICRDLSKHLGIRVDPHRIIRTAHTASQASLNKQERHKNLITAFKIDGSLNGEVVALVDDVITTGATVELLSKRLIEAGAKAVYVWSLARTPLER